MPDSRALGESYQVNVLNAYSGSGQGFAYYRVAAAYVMLCYLGRNKAPAPGGKTVRTVG